jgi:hypothetical protein
MTQKKVSFVDKSDESVVSLESFAVAWTMYPEITLESIGKIP